ncbi:hypothetical protein [uncultured Mucilaginibacter sp.]|uniref:hypothetical protein n=1 Tax=uncultured Mucilaginibacter sp. TaxID=797541 RepID=UPI0025D3E83B|nr:hypothetical protein [uncultured Mucilaginibacter sp.]
MKKLLLLLVVIAAGSSAIAQTMPPIDGLKLTTKEDYRAADTIALQVANYILATPSDEKSTPRLNGTSFLLKWMGGTADYSFDLDEKVIKYFVKDLDLMGVYMAALTSSALQNKTPKDSKSLTTLAAKRFVEYINTPANNVKMNGKLKKLTEAEQNGEL